MTTKSTSLRLEAYSAQVERWPQSGRHVLAQFDDTTVVVYQAYCREIGEFAVQHGYFGGPFSVSRMSWIKPNFLWMMYRCGWGRKPNQEVILAIRLHRRAFDEILKNAVHSAYVAEVYGTRDRWQQEVDESCVRIQWDPDRDPSRAPVQRRAVQLGLRGEVLAKYAKEWIVSIEDVSELVSSQARNASLPYTNLLTPCESVYLVADLPTARRLGVDAGDHETACG